MFDQDDVAELYRNDPGLIDGDYKAEKAMSLANLRRHLDDAEQASGGGYVSTLLALRTFFSSGYQPTFNDELYGRFANVDEAVSELLDALALCSSARCLPAVLPEERSECHG